MIKRILGMLFFNKERVILLKTLEDNYVLRIEANQLFEDNKRLKTRVSDDGKMLEAIFAKYPNIDKVIALENAVKWQQDKCACMPSSSVVCTKGTVGCWINHEGI